MSLAAALEPDLAEAIARTCDKCWKAEHPPPPASALVLMEDYRWQLSYQSRLAGQAGQLAERFQGSLSELQLAAHREMYARTGDDADLARMLRHVT